LIKASYILESISQVLVLNERNIINTDMVDEWVQGFVEDTDKPEIKRWLETRLRKYIINDMPGEHPLTKRDLKENPDMFDEPWMVQALERGETLYFINLDGQEDFFEGALPHVIDYLEYVLDHEREVPWNLQFRDITSLSVEDAIEKSNDWMRWLNKDSDSDDDEGGVEQVLRVGGFRWVELISKAALDYEGNMMGHCVRSYWGRVERGDCRIFSLRDSSNESHVTIEVADDEMRQIQGKQNKPPIEKYWDAIVEFLNYGLKKHIFSKFSNMMYLDDIEALFYNGVVYTEKTAPPDVLKLFNVKYLKIAYVNRDMEGMKKYLDMGFDPSLVKFKSTYTRSGEISLLADAAIEKELEIIRLFLPYVKQVDPEDSEERSLFFGSVLNWRDNSNSGESFRRSVLELFLKYGADIDRVDAHQGKTALEMAAGSEEISRFLIERGADITKQSNPHGEPVIVSWLKWEFYDLVLEAIDKGVDINIRDNNGWTLLHYAVWKGDPDTSFISKLLKKGADINAFATAQITPLQLAAHSGASLDFLEFLLKKGADPNLGDSNYLNYVKKDNPRLADLFVRYGEKA
jgi:hypothetical protein